MMTKSKAGCQTIGCRVASCAYNKVPAVISTVSRSHPAEAVTPAKPAMKASAPYKAR